MHDVEGESAAGLFPADDEGTHPDGDPEAQDEAVAALDALSRETLEFESKWWKYPAAKDAAILEKFGESPTRYYQRLLVLLDSPAAEAEFPALVRRLQRVRDRRRAARSARRIA